MDLEKNFFLHDLSSSSYVVYDPLYNLYRLILGHFPPCLFSSLSYLCLQGLTHEFDKEPAIFGTYQYKVDDGAEPLQYFPVQNKTIVVPYEFVEMKIESNHGNGNYTCLYRVRVHGIPLP